MPGQAAFVLFLGMCLFAPAGTLARWQAWLFIAVFIGASDALGVYFVKHDPALIERRRRAGPTAEMEPAQKIIMVVIRIGFLALLVVPGFDHRWHWSASPPWLAFVGEAGVILSFVVFFVVMKQNSYAAATITVEADQPVVSTGLYAFIRHPMYAGGLLLMIAIPLALASTWTLLTLVSAVRLIPGVW
ncbi:MAG: isoprenylcysteine carboxylmethyltransferase family protein [Pseudolabrys sp.]